MQNLYDPRNPHWKRNMAFGLKQPSGILYGNHSWKELKRAFRRALVRIPEEEVPLARQIFNKAFNASGSWQEKREKICAELGICMKTYCKRRDELLEFMEVMNVLLPFNAFARQKVGRPPKSATSTEDNCLTR